MFCVGDHNVKLPVSLHERCTVIAGSHYCQWVSEIQKGTFISGCLLMFWRLATWVFIKRLLNSFCTYLSIEYYTHYSALEGIWKRVTGPLRREASGRISGLERSQSESSRNTEDAIEDTYSWKIYFLWTMLSYWSNKMGTLTDECSRNLWLC